MITAEQVQQLGEISEEIQKRFTTYEAIVDIKDGIFKSDVVFVERVDENILKEKAFIDEKLIELQSLTKDLMEDLL